MKRTVLVSVLLLLTVTSLAAAPRRQSGLQPDPVGPLAAEPPETPTTGIGIPIWKPITISQPGRYVVIRNVRAPGPIIDIQSSDVSIDLNGFVLENTTDVGSVIQAFPTPLQNVTIQNGTTRGGASCIFVDRVDHLVLRDLAVVGCNVGIFLDDNKSAEVEQNRVKATTIGISLDDCKNCRIADNNVIGGLELGIGVEIGTGTEISGNRVTASDNGIRAGGTGLSIRDNIVSGCTEGMRIQTKSSQVQGNTISKCDIGLKFTPQAAGNVYRGNTARDSNTDFVDDGEDNTSHGDNYLPGRM